MTISNVKKFHFNSFDSPSRFIYDIVDGGHVRNQNLWRSEIRDIYPIEFIISSRIDTDTDMLLLFINKSV